MPISPTTRHFFLFILSLLLGVLFYPQASTASISPSSGSSISRPLDYSITIPGPHTIGDVVEFNHSLGSDPANLHPVYVYSEDGNTIWGVGRYAELFDAGVVPPPIFGSGVDNDIVIEGSALFEPPRSALSITAKAGQITLIVNDASGFRAGNEILLHQVQGTNAGTYEFAMIATKNGNELILEKPLQYTYYHQAPDKAQAVVVRHYQNVTLSTGSTWTATDWNDREGGIVVFRANGTVSVHGAIDATGKGYWGGVGRPEPNAASQQGEGDIGRGEWSQAANGSGGGGGLTEHATQVWTGGAGGGNGTVGGNGGSHNGSPTSFGGSVSGNNALTTAVFGGGGGGFTNQTGGDGGGMVLMFANNVNIGSTIFANGAEGVGEQWGSSGSGGGAGGSILIKAGEIALGSSLVQAIGGVGGASTVGTPGGNGGNGRIRVEYCRTISGTSLPTASIQPLGCQIIEQIESPPYTTTQLTLPESFVDPKTYNVHYGRRVLVGSSGVQLTSLRVPIGAWVNVSLDAMLSDYTGTPTTFQLDIGNNGSWDWTYNGTLTEPTILPSVNLATAFTDYWHSQGSPQSGSLNVPIRVNYSTSGQVLLTNMAMEAVAVTPTVTSTPPLNTTPTPTTSHTPTVTHTVGPVGTVTTTPISTRTPTTPVFDGAVFIPLVLRNYAFATPLPTYTPVPTCMTVDQEPNNLYIEADSHLPLCQGITVNGLVSPTNDVNDIYRIEVGGSHGIVQIALTNLPAGTDYDLYLDAGPGNNVAFSTNSGSANEIIRVEVAPGRYYIRVVARRGGNQNAYQLIWTSD